MNKKILPIELNVTLTTDCRLQERLSIIQTSPYGRAWLATHLEVFMDDNLSIGFGTGNCVADLNYFDDILESQEVDLWSTTPSAIVNVIIDCIENNNYVIIDLYWGKKYKEDISVNKTFSVLVYGFDKESKEFYITGIENNKYVEQHIDFFELQELYGDAYDVYKEDATTKVLRQYFNFAITRIFLKSNYFDDNCIFNAIVQKLGREEAGLSMDVSQYDSQENEINSFKRYTGINCLLGIKQVLLNCDIQSETFISMAKNLHKTFYQLYEHRKSNITTMEWIIEHIKTDDSISNQAIEEYRKLTENMFIIYNLSEKLHLKKDKAILDRIVNKVTVQYQKEKETLIKFIGTSFKNYISRASYDNYIQK